MFDAEQRLDRLQQALCRDVRPDAGAGEARHDACARSWNTRIANGFYSRSRHRAASWTAGRSNFGEVSLARSRSWPTGASSTSRCRQHGERRPRRHARGHHRAPEAQRAARAAAPLLKEQEEQLRAAEPAARCRAQQHGAGPGHVRCRAARSSLCNRRYAEIYGLTPEQVSPAPRCGRSSSTASPTACMPARSPEQIVEPMLSPARRRPGLRAVTSASSSDGRCIAVSVQPHGRRRHGHDAPGHHRAAPLRGQDRAHGAARRADRPAQPRAAQRAARAGADARQARRDGGRPPARSRPLQDRERHARPSRRRQAAARWWPSACARWCARPTRSRAWAATSSPSCRSAIAQPADATALAQRIIEAVSEPYEIDGHQVVIGTSVGIAVGPADGASPDQLIRNADLALYRAKGDGRGTYRFFEPEMDAQMQARRALEYDLRKALAGRRVRAALPARRQSREQRDQRLRGADPLAPSREGPGPARHVHPAGRGDRLHRPARRVGDPAGLRDGRAMARRI